MLDCDATGGANGTHVRLYRHTEGRRPAHQPRHGCQDAGRLQATRPEQLQERRLHLGRAQRFEVGKEQLQIPVVPAPDGAVALGAAQAELLEAGQRLGIRVRADELVFDLQCAGKGGRRAVGPAGGVAVQHNAVRPARGLHVNQHPLPIIGVNGRSSPCQEVRAAGGAQHSHYGGQGVVPRHDAASDVQAIRPQLQRQRGSG